MLETHHGTPIPRASFTPTPCIVMASYAYFALGATLLLGVGMLALRREHRLSVVSDDIEWF